MAGTKPKTYFITTASQDVAAVLLDFLAMKGFSVFDEGLSQRASLVVFNTTHNKLSRGIREARESGLLIGPYRIRVSEIHIKERPLFQEGRVFEELVAR